VQAPTSNSGDRASFIPSARVTSSEIFALAIKSRPIAKGQFFFLHIVTRDSGGPSLGLIVPKRLLKKATSRNSAKRVVREAFRKIQHRLPRADIIIRLKAAPTPGSLTILKKLLRSDVDALLQKAAGGT